MSIEFAIVKGWEIPEGIIKQIIDAKGRMLWCAMKMVKLTVTSTFNSMDGDTARITVNSPSPFAPDPKNPSNKVTSWTVFVYDEPNCTIDIPIGSTIECYVTRDKGNADSYINLNDTKVVTGEGTYIYTVTGDVTIDVSDQYSQGEYGTITIIEAKWANTTILEINKLEFSSYANGTSYNNNCVVLDIYPKTNSTVKITYGGLTKTIKDTSGAAQPNAQQVFFGTFNGVSDTVETPDTGELTIEGDCRGYGYTSYRTSSSAKSDATLCGLIIEVIKWSKSIDFIPNNAFTLCEFTTIIIPNGVTTIGDSAFENCYELADVTIPGSVTSIGDNAFSDIMNNTHVYKILATMPPSIGTDAFDSETTNRTIIVPKGCGDIYKAAAGWSNYADIIVEAN